MNKKRNFILLHNNEPVAVELKAFWGSDVYLEEIAVNDRSLDSSLELLDSYLTKQPDSIVIDMVDAHTLDYIAPTVLTEEERDQQYVINVEFTSQVASICFNHGIHMIFLSSDQVFNDDDIEKTFNEEAFPFPSNWYGKVKYLAEREIFASGVEYTILRIGSILSSSPNHLLAQIRRYLEQNTLPSLAMDQQLSPIYLGDIAKSIELISDDLMLSRNKIYHLAADELITPYELALRMQNQLESNSEIVSASVLDTVIDEDQEEPNEYSLNSALDNSLFKTDFSMVFTPIDNAIALIVDKWNEA
ncbi:sugar nucleotide-binding protein [candidate division WWE3 bacterium]|nr:sugar nucleotide-binding protein [candidate division WWE3 bacterium]